MFLWLRINTIFSVVFIKTEQLRRPIGILVPNAQRGRVYRWKLNSPLYPVLFAYNSWAAHERLFIYKFIYTV